MAGRFEVIVKELARPALTVAVDRTTLKIPLDMGGDERALFERVAQSITDQIWQPTMQTLRGRFSQSHQNISLVKGVAQTNEATFVYDQDGVATRKGRFQKDA